MLGKIASVEYATFVQVQKVKKGIPGGQKRWQQAYQAAAASKRLMMREREF